MTGLRQIFIKNLKFYRKIKNKRQLDLALDLGKNPNYINAIENGKYFPSPETIEEIARVLEIEPLQLFDRDTPESDTENARGSSFIEEKIDLKLIEFKLQETLSKDISKIFAEISA